VIGNGHASRQQRFLVFEADQEYVLLRTYGDLMIGAALDRENRVVGPRLLFIRGSSAERLEFKQEELGELEHALDAKPAAVQLAP
jgi:hypothetical protein